MVPLKLELKNFLSYGDMQLIDFSEHNLICLSGKNGHGKSAILDAITWVIWGQARKPGCASRADEGLIKIGQTKMLVILDFKLNQQIYRIRREFLKSLHKPITNLEFFIYSDSSKEFVPLTEKSIRLTQKKIDLTLKIDFETFLNSSFLKQGNSNEFSKKSPRERKILLTKILGFDQYDNTCQKILDHAKTKTLELKKLVAIEEKNNAAIADLPTLQNKVSTLSILLANTTENLEAKQNAKILLSEKRHQLDTQIEKTKQYLDKQKIINASLTELKEKFFNIAKTWRQNHKIIIDAKIDKNLDIKIKETEHRLKDLEQKLLLKISLGQKILNYKSALNTQEQTISARFDITKSNLIQSYQQSEINIATIKAEQKNIESKVSSLEFTLKNMAEENIKIDELLSKNIALQTNIESMNITLQHLRNKLAKFENMATKFADLLTTISHTDISVHNVCQTCLQAVPLNQQHILSYKKVFKKNLLEHQLKQLCKIMPLLKQKIHYTDSRLKEATEKALSLREVQYKKTELRTLQEKLTLELKENNQVLHTNKQNLNSEIYKKEQLANSLQKIDLDKNLTISQDLAIQEQLKQINDYQSNISNLENVENDFSLCKTELDQYIYQKNLYHSIQTKKTEQALWLERLRDIKSVIMTSKNNASELEVKIGNIDTIKSEYLELKQNWEQLTQSINTTLNEQKKLFQDIANEQAQISLRENMQQENESIIKTIASLQSDIADDELLAEAFGKNGIQALLLEDVLPEIEHATNLILDVISETNAKVFIEPLRDLKKGGVKESLDIIISDINGIRDYEMFSGGEAFRIDFALRIGISQIISRRSGATLSTLIIDEGFGALDEEGINLMTNCIYKISNLFEKIIVVSHLPSLKETFPVHLNVSKDSTGSKITIEYRG